MTSLRLKDEDFSDGLYNIARVIDYLQGGGNDYGCGVDHSNGVFTMYGYWAHSECDVCNGRSWDASQEVSTGAGFTEEEINDFSFHEWHDPRYPKDYTEQYDAVMNRLESENPHDCPEVEWHFEHPASGLKVKWYKRIGRSTESNTDLTMTQWYTIVLECLESLREGAKG